MMAMMNRHDPADHACYMIGTGLALVNPVVSRLAYRAATAAIRCSIQVARRLFSALPSLSWRSVGPGVGIVMPLAGCPPHAEIVPGAEGEDRRQNSGER